MISHQWIDTDSHEEIDGRRQVGKESDRQLREGYKAIHQVVIMCVAACLTCAVAAVLPIYHAFIAHAVMANAIPHYELQGTAVGDLVAAGYYRGGESSYDQLPASLL